MGAPTEFAHVRAQRWWDPRRQLVGVRLLALAAIVVVVLADDTPLDTTVVVLGVAWVVYAAVSSLFLLDGRLRPPTAAIVDVLVLAGAIEVAGDADSLLAYLLLTAPLVFAPFLAPRDLVVVCAVVPAAYAVVAVVGDTLSTETRESVAVWYVLAALASGLALLQSALRERQLDAQRTLSESRRRLAVDVANAQTRERRRLAQALHDDALQRLLALRQDLEEAPSPDVLARAREDLVAAIAALRGAVHDLHPVVLRHGGLDPALHALADHQAARGRFTPHVAVDPASEGVADELVLSLARELVENAARHARASTVHIGVRRDGEAVLLDVVDDGDGFPEGRRAEALRDGHVGLASCAERAEAVGGSLDVRSTPGQGTAVRVRLPPVPVPAADPAPSG